MIGFKATLSLDGTAVSDAVTITIPKRSAGLREYATHNQADRYKRKEKQLLNCEVLKCECEFTKALDTTLNTLFEKVEDVAVIVGTPDPDGAGSGTPRTFTFNGGVLAIEEIPMNVEEGMLIKFEVYVNGKMTPG